MESEKKEDKKKRIEWHRLFAALLHYLLTPVEIEVHHDIELLNDPPEADLILLRMSGETWSEEQKARLPDGIRQSSCPRILMEFKYTESVTAARAR